MTAPARPRGGADDGAGTAPTTSGGGAVRPDRLATTTAALVAAAVVVAAGVAFRLYTRSDLWLDEALSVNIARLDPGDLVDALARDGHPPLYYLLLHGWMALFGDGDVAVRALSGVFGVAALPLAYLVGRRLGGERAGLATLLLLAASPFAVRYATETRMYSMVMVLVLAGWLALRAALERPTPARLALVGLLGGLLALTHYWAIYLLAATALVLAAGWRRGAPHAGRALVGLAASAVVFLPWLPTFLEQAGSTGTPWGRPERPSVVVMVSLTDWGGGPNAEAQLVGIALLILVGVALFGRPVDGETLALDVRTRPGVRAEVAIAALTLLLAVAAGYATSSAFASRYTATIFPIVVVVAGYGISRLPGRALLPVLVPVLALSAIGDVRNLVTQRTQAGEVAAYIVDHGRPGDVVAYCPDQLGPAVSRLLPTDRVQRTFPAGGDPAFVDWVDYAEKQEAGDPEAFARDLLDRAGEATIWLVWEAGYRTLGTRCEDLGNALARLRPAVAVVSSGDTFEHAVLYQYGPGR